MASRSEARAREGELMTAAQVQAAEEAGASEFELGQIFSLKERAAEFAAAFDALLSWEQQIAGTDLEPEYQRLVDRGFSLHDTVTEVMAQIDSALGWVRGVFGLEGLRATGTLGLVWFIPLAAIAAALAALSFWLNDYIKFSKRFTEQQRIARELEAQGVAPVEAQRQAAAAVAATAPSGFLAPLATPLGMLALVGGGWFVWRWWQSR